MTKGTSAASPCWRKEDLAEATAKALALTRLLSPVLGIITTDQPRAPRDGRAAA